MARGDPLPRQYPPPVRFGPLPAKYARMGRSPVFLTESSVSIQGANVLYEHFLAAAAIIEQTAPEIMNVVGDIGVEEARSLVPYETGATHDSITIVGGSSKSSSSTFGFRVAGENHFTVEIGPETYYAPFLEYGTIFMQPRPFMMPAADLMEAVLTASISALLNVVMGESSTLGGGSGGGMTGRVMNDPRVRGPYTSLRSFLYSGSKALGDISVLGGRGLFGPIRGEMLSLARLLGDVGSIMNRTVSTRISNRLSGRVSGHIIGFGSRSLSFGRTYSAFPGGEGGRRIYQRVAGHSINFGSSANMLSRYFN